MRYVLGQFAFKRSWFAGSARHARRSACERSRLAGSARHARSVSRRRSRLAGSARRARLYSRWRSRYRGSAPQMTSRDSRKETVDECKPDVIGASLQVTRAPGQLAQIPSASRISLWRCTVPDRQLQLPYLAQTKTGIRPWSNARASLPCCGYQAPGCRHARRAESKWPASGPASFS
jgi:hypothetical protein